MVHLDLRDLPSEPSEALGYLLDLENEIDTLLGEAYVRTYFELRLAGRLEEAFDLGRHSRKEILAMVRRRNNEAGRPVVWGDGLDRYSTGYAHS